MIFIFWGKMAAHTCSGSGRNRSEQRAIPTESTFTIHTCFFVIPAKYIPYRSPVKRNIFTLAFVSSAWTAATTSRIGTTMLNHSGTAPLSLPVPLLLLEHLFFPTGQVSEYRFASRPAAVRVFHPVGLFGSCGKRLWG